MAKNDGKPCEQFAKDIIKENNWAMLRLQDTKAASRYLPPQPADFMGAIQGIPVLLECKSSLEQETFKDCQLKSYVKPTQVGYFKLWQRSGGVGIFMFYSESTKNIELWNANIVLHAYTNGWGSQVPFYSGIKNKKETAKEIVNFILKGH